jgi:hypothetical protein
MPNLGGRFSTSESKEGNLETAADTAVGTGRPVLRILLSGQRKDIAFCKRLR